jgi:dihydroflavonol-4-reductase
MKEMVLLTGGNGFIGSHIAELLIQTGYPVRCLLRPQSKPSWISSLPVEITRLNYGNTEALDQAVYGCTSIIHFGGATKASNEAAYLDANVETTRALLEALKRNKSKAQFILCSSQAALGPSPTIKPLRETAEPHPISVYGKSKLLAENLCQQYQDLFPISVIRPPAVYGPRDRDILIFFKFIQRGISPTIGKGERYLSLVNALDIAMFVTSLLEKRPAGVNIYQITDGVPHTWSEISEAIATALGKKPLRITIPVGIAASIGKTMSLWSSVSGRLATLNREKLAEILQSYWLMDSHKAETDVGFQPKWDLKSGVEMTAQWYKDQGWL